MATQRLISARIAETTLWEMEQETMVTGTKRNRILNEGARLWLSLEDARRVCRAFPAPEQRMKALVHFVKLWFPEVEDLVSVENPYK